MKAVFLSSFCSRFKCAQAAFTASGAVRIRYPKALVEGLTPVIPPFTATAPASLVMSPFTATAPAFLACTTSEGVASLGPFSCVFPAVSPRTQKAFESFVCDTVTFTEDVS